ncbi:hypothetical protein APF79_03595 [bacterium BRH_c32]|nr:MAG: hypothetical protein APF79_03595 [bacterium BRH_c32]
MLINEAKWLGTQIMSIELKTGSRFLNFGSQSENYNKTNDHILKYFLNPIKTKHTVINLDLGPGAGVDIVGNIYDNDFFEELKKESFDCILLCNVLEHVEDIEEICTRLNLLLKEGGFILFSGPKDYPTHFDPIDNGFRPSIEDVSRLFPKFVVVKSEIITDYKFSYYVLRNPKRIIIEIIRLLTPFYKFEKWKNAVLPKYRYWNKNFKVTCLILKKKKYSKESI